MSARLVVGKCLVTEGRCMDIECDGGVFGCERFKLRQQYVHESVNGICEKSA